MPILLLLTFLYSFSIFLHEMTLSTALGVLFFHDIPPLILMMSIAGIGFAVLTSFWKWPRWLDALFSLAALAFAVQTFLKNPEIEALLWSNLLFFFFAARCLVTAFTSGLSVRDILLCEAAGGALGVLAAMFLIRPLSLEGLVLVNAAVLSLTLIFSFSSRLFRTIAVLPLLAILVILSSHLFIRQLEMFDGLSKGHKYEGMKQPRAIAHPLYQQGWKRWGTEWSLLGRIDLLENPETQEVPFFVNDVNYGGVYRADSPYDNGTFSLIPKVSTAFVIGAGGGLDLWALEQRGVKKISGAEINPALFHLMTTTMREYSGRIFERNGIREGDGRSLLATTREPQELILLTHADLEQNVFGSAIAAANQLFTLEGMAEYIDHLTDNGFLAITTTLTSFNPRIPRAINTLRVATGEKNIPFAESVVLVSHRREEFVPGKSRNLGYLFFKKGKWTDEEMSEMRSRVKMRENMVILWPPENPDLKLDEAESWAVAILKGELVPKDTEEPLLTPVTDNRPTFNIYDRAHRLHHLLPSSALQWLLVLSGLVLVLFVWQLVLPSSRGVRFPASLALILGLPFSLWQMAVLQMTGVVLGSPVLIFAVSLLGVTVPWGVGVWISRFSWSRALFLSAAFLAVVGGLWVGPGELRHALPLSMRPFVLVLILIAFSLGLSVLFPRALAQVQERSARLAAVSFAGNCLLTVVGYFLGNTVLLKFGIRECWLAAAALYFILGISLWARERFSQGAGH